MGCAASTDGAERRRRDPELGNSEASTTDPLVVRQQDPAAAAAAPAGPGRRRGCKVAPEPKEEEEPAPPLPGSPSFRFYCQKAAAVDALVAAADADGGVCDGSISVTETPQEIKKGDLAHSSNGSSKPKEVGGWLKFRGMSIVAAVYSLFSRHSSTASAPPAAAKSHHPSAASPPAPAAAAVAVSSP